MGVGLLFGFIKLVVTIMGKIILKILLFTGAWITLALVIISKVVQEKYFPTLEVDNPTIWWIFQNVWGCITIIPTIYVTVQNVIRLLSGNQDFSLMGIFESMNRKQKKTIKPKATKEIKELAPSGVIFGKEGVNFITKPENKDGHILVIGGAGSGKSSCIAIPSLMSWKERVFVIDIKGELLKKTRAKRNLVKVFNPSDPLACGYDPFYVLAQSDNLGQDMKQIVMAIIPLSPNVKDPFWINAAQNYLTGALLFFYKRGKNFIEAITEVQKTPPTKLINAIKESNNEMAKLYTNQFIDLDIKTLSGVFTELSNKIMLFATDEQLKRALSQSEVITPEHIEKGFDIYLCLEESKLEQWNGLLTLMVNQFLKHFERREDMNATPVLFLLDEFARLGKIEAITNGLATLRSKKITITILTQSLAQLDVIYGKENRQVIADNCQYKAILNATDADTQEYFSKLVGTYEKEKTSYNSNYEQYTGLGKGTGVSRTTEEKRIIRPEEFATLKDLVLLTPYGFFRVNKTPYYSTKVFQIEEKRLIG